jgi:hypothetical protein
VNRFVGRPVVAAVGRSLVAALLAGAAAPACLVGPVEGIPCSVDDECATGAFCDVPRASCAPGTAPDVQVEGVVVDDAVVVDVFVPPDETTALAMRVQNRGGAPAEDLALRFGELACMNLVIDDAAVPTELRAGEAVDVAFTVTPQLCSTPAIQDWFFTFSGRGTRGTFNIVLQRAPPSGN